MSGTLSIRSASPEDAGVICGFLQKLLQMEGEMDPHFSGAATDPDTMREMLEERSVCALLAYQAEIPVGVAVYHTYRLAGAMGRRVIYLEELFCEEPCRGTGVGYALMQKLCEIAKEMDCVKIEWKCLTENNSAIRFYEKLGAEIDPVLVTFTWKKSNFLK